MARALAQARPHRSVLPPLNIQEENEAMPTFNIQLFEGRTVEEKRKFVEAITRTTCETLGCEPGSVDIILTDVKRENWATAGKLWSDR
ncbi:4-oxalocrotonate tautomerase [Caballeronia sp. AZ10_KS36]|uniref:4-oxalocrotonate tautomerase n=1 Tax=Caballeronia sp. AZ10_KS36 TaxID=2921757 RepID=UPI00202907A7|nr:4-oxalocrotonate tautomerase [Caballeronia sp. AZ10_KS36]